MYTALPQSLPSSSLQTRGEQQTNYSMYEVLLKKKQKETRSGGMEVN